MKFKKQLKLLATTLVICMAFSGCTSAPTKESSTTSANNTETAQPLTFGISDTAVFSTMKVTANEIKENSGTSFFKPESGNVFVGVNFTIENTSDSDISVSSLLFFTTYVDGVKCDYSLNANCAFDNGTLDGTLAPGKKLIGWHCVEVPAQWQELEIQFNDSILSSSDNAAVFIFNK